MHTLSQDEVLFGMQQKLDALCDQLSSSKDQPAGVSLTDAFTAKSFECGCKLCQHHNPPENGTLVKKV